jgi:twitching motility protein PilJ
MARQTKSGRKNHSRQKGFLLRREKRQQKMTPTNFKPSTQKSGRLYAMVGFLVILLAFVAVTFFLITKESRNEQIWIRLSTDLQVHSQQLAKSAAEAVEGHSASFVQLGDSRGTIADAVDALKNGDSTRSLPPLPGAMAQTLTELDKTWSRMDANASSILDREELVLDLAASSKSFIQVIPEIQELTDQAVRELTRGNAPSQQVFVSGRQLVAAEPAQSRQRIISPGRSVISNRPWMRCSWDAKAWVSRRLPTKRH